MLIGLSRKQNVKKASEENHSKRLFLLRKKKPVNLFINTKAKLNFAWPSEKTVESSTERVKKWKKRGKVKVIKILTSAGIEPLDFEIKSLTF